MDSGGRRETAEAAVAKTEVTLRNQDVSICAGNGKYVSRVNAIDSCRAETRPYALRGRIFCVKPGGTAGV